MRLDIICFIVKYQSYSQNCCDNTYYKHAVRVLRYWIFTKLMKFTCCRNADSGILNCYVDLDWAGDVTDKNSTCI